MGFLAAVIDTVRKTLVNIRANTGGGSALTASLFGAPGDDSNPLKDDRVILIRAQGNGSVVCVGTADTKNKGVTSPGERRIYSRTTSGTVAATIYLKNDGSIDLNGLIISASGAVTLPPAAALRVGAAGVNLVTHIHTTPSGPSGSPLPGV